MRKLGLLVGELAATAGVSRKALRLYEAAGILAAARTPAGYRVYDSDAVDVVRFVRAAQRSGFSLSEVKDVIALRRSGRCPCRHVRNLAKAKIADVEQQLADLSVIRANLARILARRPGSRLKGAAICPHLEDGVGDRQERSTP